MLKPVVDRLRTQDCLFKKLREIQPKELGIRNRIRLFDALDLSGEYSALFVVAQKSRVLRKDVEKYETILRKLETAVGHGFKHRLLMLDAPLCSKAKALFIERGWRLV